MTSGIVRGDLRAFAKGLGLELWQAVVLLAERGIKVDPETGEFDASPVTNLLATPESSTASKEARAEVIRSHRERLRTALTKAGLKYVGNDFPRGTLLKFMRPGLKKSHPGAGQAINVLCYVATSLNRFGQISFTINHLLDDQVHWVALVAAPLDRTFLFTRDELRQQAGDGKDSLSLTIRAGTSDANALEHRLEELVQRQEVKK